MCSQFILSEVLETSSLSFRASLTSSRGVPQHPRSLPKTTYSAPVLRKISSSKSAKCFLSALMTRFSINL